MLIINDFFLIVSIVILFIIVDVSSHFNQVSLAFIFVLFKVTVNNFSCIEKTSKNIRYCKSLSMNKREACL